MEVLNLSSKTGGSLSLVKARRSSWTLANPTVETIEGTMSSTTDNLQPKPETRQTQSEAPVAPSKPHATAKQEAKFPAGKTAEEFRKMELPKKEALIEGLLYRRDLVAFACSIYYALATCGHQFI